MKSKTSIRRIFKNNLFLLRYIYKFTPAYLILEIVFSMFSGIISASFSIYTKLFFDALAEGRSFWYLVVLTLAFFLVTNGFYVLQNHYYIVFRESQKQILKYKMNHDLFRVARRVDLADYDNSEFYNDFIWAMHQSDQRAADMMGQFNDLIFCLFHFLTSAVILATLGWQIALLAVILALLSYLLQRVLNRLDVSHAEQENPLQRKISYLERIFLLPDTAKEVRITHVSDIALGKLNTVLTEKRNLDETYARKRLGATIPLNVIGALCEPLVYLILLYRIIVLKSLTIGSLTIAISSFWGLKNGLDSFLYLLANFEKSALFTERVRALYDYHPKLKCGNVPFTRLESITLQDLHFGYSPDQEVLHGINLTLRRGEKVAFVGFNGAGKSTLIKLILHYYNPTSGTIIVNGRDISDYDCDSYRAAIGAVHQDYQVYAMSIAENVMCDAVTDADTPHVLKALEMADFGDRLRQMPNGIQTELTKEFYEDGTNLSGGESQKIAIARIFARPFELIIMDEPSSALDPEAEYHLNQQIRDFSTDKTVIFISHRLSSTRHADRIYFFEEGRIVEEGTHESLMAQNGKYAEMFRIQAQKYRNAEAADTDTTGN